jgi:DNA repair exonuclease SbcCD ATPase subunit/DNA repair exonuclease SbcCD nuclease subunit
MLQHIFHLSDLHIRNGDKKYSRYDEYKDVFDNTITSLKINIANKDLSKEDFIIIITGDIFHNKNNIGNYGLLLYKDFITELTKVGRVIIIHGNHDKQQSELKQPSLVFSSTFQIDNLIILNETSSFVIDDVGFSYVSVDDTLDFKANSGRLSNLPAFPKFDSDVKYKVALFHGTFSKSKLYNGEVISEDNNPYPLEWVQDFDFVLLGDIHKRQTSIYKGKTYYGYSGSLVQQNFGEDILEHGYLIWDLSNKKITEINVYNNIGYINIKQNDNEELLIRCNGKYDLLLETAIVNNLEMFPKCLEIKSFSQFNFEKLNSLLNKYNISYSILSRNLEQSLLKDYKPVNNIHSEENINDIANNEFILAYFNKILPPERYSLLLNIINNKESLLFDISKYPEDLHDECSKKNKDINASIVSCNKSLELNNNKSIFLIKYLEWDSLLCYENKNWLNMHELDSKTFMVKGKNGTGKSAIYDILLLAIWGDNTKMKIKGNTSLSAGMINHKKNKAYTIIDIELNGKLYRIERDFAKRKDSNLLHVKNSVLYEYVNDKELVLLKKESACNDEVKKLFGTMDDFLTTSMITQNVDNDILKFDSKKCLELIDKSYNIDYIYNLYNLFKLTINKYRDFNRTIENKKQVYQKLVSSNQINDISEDELNDKTAQLNLLNDEKLELLSQFNSITIDIKNPIYITILNTDYETLMKGITDSFGEFNDDEINLKRERYNELKLLLKDETDLLKLKALYTNDIELQLKGMVHIHKPCELSILQNEELQLKDYLNVDYSDYQSNDLSLLEKELNDCIIQKSELNLKLSDLVSSKPTKVDNPNISKEDCIKDVVKYFKSIKNLNKYISKHPKIDSFQSLVLPSDKYKPITEADYYKHKDRYNELCSLLKDEADLDSLICKYNKNIQKDFDKLKPIQKPCELSFLQNEASQLKEFLNVDYTGLNCDDIVSLEKELFDCEKQISELELKQSELIAIKPSKVDIPNISKDDCINDILKIFDSIHDFNQFISNNTILDYSLTDSNRSIITYSTYIKLSANKKILHKKLNDFNHLLAKLDDDFKSSFNLQQSILTVNKPSIPISNKKIKHNSSAINKEIDKINIEKYINNISIFDEQLSSFNILKNSISDLELSLANYNQELAIFLNNDEYNFNPNCECCCNKPWVNRIKDLESIIDNLSIDIQHKKSLFNDSDYNLLIRNISSNNNIIDYYHLLFDWFYYYKYKETFDKLTKDLNSIISRKDSINNEIVSTNYKINDITIDINNFNIHYLLLSQLYDSISSYDNYLFWETSYNSIYSSINSLTKSFIDLRFKLNYNKNIRPRIDNYNSINHNYHLWHDYDSKLKIISAFQLSQLKIIIDQYNIFNHYSYHIYNSLNTIDLYIIYLSWETSYNSVSSSISLLTNSINDLEFKINYLKNIRPRINNYYSIKNDYHLWCDYDSKLKIVRAYELFKLNDYIQVFENYNDLKYNNNLKPLIKQKFQLSHSIKDIEKSIKIINDDLIKFYTINSLNNDNKSYYNLLLQLSNHLLSIIDTLDFIIFNFQAFRIQLYEKHILNNLISNTNTIINNLCHSDTKPFKLDYLLNVSKDIIHINWLINDTDCNNKIISISQASGFQHFTISIALRMCLFLNKNNLYCNQLFIDEGFVSFDNFNLSIVPSFLKNLLSYFNSIIIVSHIDIIQDNIDDSVSIIYNRSNSSSSVSYDMSKNIIKTRIKKL